MKDLGEYWYTGRHVLPGVLPVGWLELRQTFSIGEVGAHIIDKLARLAAEKPVNQARGYHRCEFCSKIEIPFIVDGVKCWLGSAEIWLPGRNGELFASPNLIVHYIDKYKYLPPAVYLDAVEELDLSTWGPPPDYGRQLTREVLAQKK